MGDLSIILRAVEPEDVDFMLECENDEASRLWSLYQAPVSRSMLLSYAVTYDADPFKNNQLRLIATTLDKVSVGCVDLYDISQKDGKAFIGICIHPDFRNKGLGHQALQALINFCQRSLALRLLVAEVAVSNVPSQNIFSRAGFNQLCILPSWHRFGRNFDDFILFSKFL